MKDATVHQFADEAITAQSESIIDFLVGADPAVLLASVATLTSDPDWLTGELRRLLDDAMGPTSAATTYQRPDGTPRALAEAAHRVLTGGQDRRPAVPSDALLLEAMKVVTGGDPGTAHLARLRQLLALDEDAPAEPETVDVPADFHVILVGMGVAGLSMAQRLRRANVPFTAIEKNPDVGGVWYENRYPDCGVDTDCALYSFSDDRLLDWSRHYARRDEILDYARRYARKHGTYDRTLFGLEVTTARYSEATQTWHVTAVDGEGIPHELSGSVLITAVGSLNRPFIPDIPGLEDFAGPKFHTARWPKDLSLDGLSVALVGNGSSGVQVGSSIAAVAGRLTALQRTPHWIKPHPRQHLAIGAGERWCMANIPFYESWYRFLVSWLEGDSVYANLRVDADWSGPGVSPRNAQALQELKDYIWTEVGGREDLYRKLLPDYPPYYKRMVMDNGWYRALASDNVELVTDRIARATKNGLVLDNGRELEFDCMVFATGFHGTQFLWPMEIRGSHGLTPSEVHGGDDELRAYIGTTMPGFPNMFTIIGPNSLVGHGGSGISIAEMQGDYILLCLRRMIAEGIGQMECTQAACGEYNERLDRDMVNMVWSAADAPSRYKSKSGRNGATHPWKLQEFWEMTQAVDWTAYELTARASVRAGEPLRS